MIALITFKFHMTIDIIFINYNSSSCTFQRSWLPLKSGHRVVHFVCVKPLTHVPLNVALWHRLSLMDPGFVISVYVCAIRQRQHLLRQHTTAETKADKPRPTQIITFTPTGHEQWPQGMIVASLHLLFVSLYTIFAWTCKSAVVGCCGGLYRATVLHF